jgi:hypothetical protein
MLAHGRSLDLKATRDQEFNQDRITSEMTSLILHQRDERLCSILLGLVNAHQGSDKSIAIVYGAAHVRAIVRVLKAANFQVVHSEWRIVFAI